MGHIAELSPLIVVALAVVGFVGGIGITAIGPGGILPTIGLFALTTLTPAEVAGSAIVTHVATGALGTWAYRRSGHLDGHGSRRTVGILALTALAGTPLGIVVNTELSPQTFGIVLAVLLAFVALALGLQPDSSPSPHRPTPVGVIAAIGLLVAVAAGVIGIGGPMLTVPLLVVCGTSMLEALGAAQVQSVLIAGTGSIGYLIHGSVDWPIAILVGVPELAGVLLGWRLARMLPTPVLKRATVIALLVIAPYVAWHR